MEYFTQDVSLVHYRAILHSAAPRVILPINNCKLSLDATRLVTIYSCLSMVMVFYFEVSAFASQYSIQNPSVLRLAVYGTVTGIKIMQKTRFIMYIFYFRSINKITV